MTEKIIHNCLQCSNIPPRLRQIIQITPTPCVFRRFSNLTTATVLLADYKKRPPWNSTRRTIVTSRPHSQKN